MAEVDASAPALTVAVTGPTGTFGMGLLPVLESDDRVERIIGIARRPFDPAERGWSKLEYQRGDVRDIETLRAAFEEADVVVHLAFLVMTGGDATAREINVGGTLSAFRAAAEAGARRFVYASSIAAYGFHRDNPVGITEDWATRPAGRLRYAQEKAELEELLLAEAAAHPDCALYLLRPPIVLGPDAAGAKTIIPELLAPVVRGVHGALRRLPPLPVLVPDLPIQFVHQDDVATAIRQCIVAAGPPGAYNIAADDLVSLVDVARAVGLRPIPVPGAPIAAAARALARIPVLPTRAQWVEVLGHPAVMDTTKAKTVLGWRPRHTAIASLAETFD